MLYEQAQQSNLVLPLNDRFSIRKNFFNYLHY